jgi:hypothetical protein
LSRLAGNDDSLRRYFDEDIVCATTIKFTRAAGGNPEIWFDRLDNVDIVVSFLSWKHRLWSIVY